MRFEELLNTLQEYRSLFDDPALASELVLTSYRDQLLSVGIDKIVFPGDGKLIVNVRGRLKADPPTDPAVSYHSRLFVVDLDWLVGKKGTASEAEGQQLAKALDAYELEGDGAYVWVVPDGFMASLTQQEQTWAAEGGGYFSHESMCVLNTSNHATRCTLEVFYESDTSRNFSHGFEVAARQSVHYRLDKMLQPDGQPMILKDEPVAYRIVSHDARVVVQGSRILTSGENSTFASFGTVVAWAPAD